MTCPFLVDDPLLRAYHDTEWGRAELDSRAMWETLVLLGFASGLSWRTILAKREALREAFAEFEPSIVAAFGAADLRRLLHNDAIIRSRRKIEAAIANARAYEAMTREGDDLASLVYSVAAAPFASRTEVCAALADELKARGFQFIGPKLVHAWLESVGVWNDHAPSCPLHDTLPMPLVFEADPEDIDEVLSRLEELVDAANDTS